MSLTDEEIINLWPSLLVPEKLVEFVRAIEALIQEKLAAQNVKPFAYIAYKEECETLRQQLAAAKLEIKQLDKLRDLQFNELTNQLAETKAEKDAEVERLQFAVQRSEMDRVCAKREAAASQAREQQMQEALIYAQRATCLAADDAPDSPIGKLYNVVSFAVEQPTNTSALEVMIAKAGEVMRARCVEYVIDHFYFSYGYEKANAIRALPGVTLEDLK